MRKGTNKERDAELMKRLQAEAPEVLSAKVDFDALVANIIVAEPDSLGDRRKHESAKSKAPKARRTR